jgi:hypothetical protein
LGRKLNPIEVASSGFPDTNAEPSLILPNRSQLLQQQIAEQLEISPEEFSKAPRLASGAPDGGASSRAFDVALSRECLELLEAFCRITDPEQRRLCLQAVRDAADSSPAAVR